MTDRFVFTRRDNDMDAATDWIRHTQLMAEYEAGPGNPPPVPTPDDGLVFHEDFSDFRIGDGQDRNFGGGWIDSWQRWGVRRLEGNNDVVIKRYVPGQTHVMDDGGLELRALKDPAGGGFIGGMISTEALYGQRLGKWECALTINNLPKGYHLWAGLFAMDGSWPPEIDMMEITANEPWTIYTNDHGFMPSVGWNGTDLSQIEMNNELVLGYEATKGRMVWTINGKTVRARPATLQRDMYFQVCWEGGSNLGGPIVDRNAVGSVTVHYVKAWPLRGQGQPVQAV